MRPVPRADLFGLRHTTICDSNPAGIRQPIGQGAEALLPNAKGCLGTQWCSVSRGARDPGEDPRNDTPLPAPRNLKLNKLSVHKAPGCSSEESQVVAAGARELRSLESRVAPPPPRPAPRPLAPLVTRSWELAAATPGQGGRHRVPARARLLQARPGGPSPRSPGPPPAHRPGPPARRGEVTAVAFLPARCLRDLMYFIRRGLLSRPPMTDERSSLPASPKAALTQINLAIKGQDA
ncbi:uncharacterized protein LOC125914327 [Panthera uncia]|uniref:uncharacterized protein LOC125914327 n=1 Tax=Panthera uncia TaxID=29064 RepID=UPI0020FF9A23|nr:uncharacterized protein LOC125914327 [Panthera uncia]